MEQIDASPAAAQDSAEKYLIEFLAHPLGAAAISASLHQIELVGARWILSLKSLDQATLLHAREETEHARLMLRESTRLRNELGPKLAEAMSAVSDTLFESTEQYLAQILKSTRRTILKPESGEALDHYVAIYFALSLLIERRLMKIYPYVSKYAQDARLKNLAQRLIVEERGHLQMIVEGVQTHVLNQGISMETLLKIEKEAYEGCMQNLKASVTSTQALYS